jgi:cytidylate kinase
VVCISREFGAQAGPLAEEVAARLGFDVCDQQLVDEVAKQAHVRRRVVESLDERVQRGITQWADRLMETQQFRTSDYLRNLSQVVLTLGRHGKSVIIGRGAHLILDPAYALRVRCYAPLQWRVAQVAAHEGLSLARAEMLVLRVESERRAFYREHFRVDVGDPEAFDLLLNVSTLPVETRAELVVAAFNARFGKASVAPKSGVRHRFETVEGRLEEREG